MKTVFFGTPALAIPFCDLLRERTDLLAVVTMPDEPTGRGYAVKPPPVKEAALSNSLPVLQPPDPVDASFQDALRHLAPELGVVVAYGKFLPPELLKVPRHGFLNVHFSLLPAYRGAAPIQRALMNGEEKTGVSLFWLDEGMDSGPLLVQRSLFVDPQDDAGSLTERLIALGTSLLGEALGDVSAGKLVRMPQQGPVTRAPTLKKEEEEIDWSQSADRIAWKIRGLAPRPGAYTFVHPAGGSPGLSTPSSKEPGRVRLKLLKALPLDVFSVEAAVPVGGVAGLVGGEGFVIKCSEGFLKVLVVQPEGKKPMSAWAYWQGSRLKSLIN